MTRHARFRVYLGGPISGCNETQRREWRQQVKEKYGSQLDFIDPTDNLVDRDALPYEFVQADLKAIEEVDGLLVNMWRESIGSAMGVMHAHRHGRPVVVADPNRLRQKMLEFYADEVVDAPLKGAHHLLDLLRAEGNWQVLKSGGKPEEPFQRQKIIEAVRSACRQARSDYIAGPGLVLPGVIRHLRRSTRRLKHSVTTSDINTAVMEILVKLEDDPLAAGAIHGVREVWRTWMEEKRRLPTGTTRLRQETARDGRAAPYDSRDVALTITSPKSHATIWGKGVKKLEDVPSAKAREVLRTIRSVPGLTSITFGPFGRKGTRKHCQATVKASRTSCVIEGTLYDKAPKGTTQTFQVRVQHEHEKASIANEIERRLKEVGLWAN